MAMKTDTLLMLGGLGLLGFGMFYMMNKQTASLEDRALQAAQASAATAGVSNPDMIREMQTMIAQSMQKSEGMSSWEKKMERDKLTAAYVQMGIQGAVAAVGAIGSFF